MREVRMTFGEHLEELRRRIINALIVVVLVLIACLFFGETLMQIAIGPHEKAIKGAQRDRTIARMENWTANLQALMSGNPEALDGVSFRLTPEEIRWELLFVHEIARSGVRAEIETSLLSTLEDVQASPSFTAEQNAALHGHFAAWGRNLSRVLSDQFVSQVAVAEGGRLVTRTRQLTDLLRQLDGEISSRVPGWGTNLQKVIGTLESFLNFLDLRRKETASGTDSGSLSAQALQQEVSRSRLPLVLDEILTTLTESARRMQLPQSRDLMVISYIENFANYLKVSIIFALVFSLPFILYEMWKFIGAGLYPHEQRYVVIFIPFSLGLFVAGGVFGYYVLIPMGLEFLAGWGVENVKLSFTLGNYIGLFFTLTLVLGLVFQIPLIMVFLSRTGLVEVDTFRRARKGAILTGFCIAALLTPPDPFTLLLMGGPMVGLYELGILVSRTLSRQREAAPTDDSDSDSDSDASSTAESESGDSPQDGE